MSLKNSVVIVIFDSCLYKTGTGFDSRLIMISALCQNGSIYLLWVLFWENRDSQFWIPVDFSCPRTWVLVQITQKNQLRYIKHVLMLCEPPYTL